MDSCLGVEREVDKVLSKFSGINEHANKVLEDAANNVENLKQEFESCKILLSYIISFHINLNAILFPDIQYHTEYETCSSLS